MTFADLQQIKEDEQAARKKVVLRCCMAAGCMSSDAKGVKEELAKAVAAAGLQDTVEVRGVGCLKLCCEGPLVQADPFNTLYVKVSPKNAPAIIEALQGVKKDLAQADPGAAFFTKQLSIVLANSGQIDPERIEAYVAADGYRALHEVLTEMQPPEVIEQITRSGLRGRGGAGFPTGLKWSTVSKTPSEKKYVICNADEGDPGAFMDRSVLESDPHSVLEGMAISAYAVGADQGFIYVRAEYPLAISRLQTAIRQAKRVGLLGMGVFESPFNFNIDIRIGAGAFVCGEETALMASVEGKRGTPRPRPPFPAQSGLWDCPTLINNVVPSPMFRPSSGAARSGSPASAPRRARAPRSSPWPARSGTRALSRCRWGRRSARLSRTWAAAPSGAASSRRCRPEALPADAFPRSTLTRRSTTSR